MTHAERVKHIHARVRIQRWEFRQRRLAHGAWHRFRLALAAAREAHAIDEPTFAALVAEGFAPDDRGKGLEPARDIVWITADRAARLTDATPLAMRLDAAMLGARVLALVAFE